MYKLICRSINKSNKSLTKFTDIYKKVSKNQHPYHHACGGEEKEKASGRLAKRRSGTSFAGRAKITFKTLLFPKRSGGQISKLSAKSFYSTGQKSKDGAPKRFFKDKSAYCLYKNAMEQCEKIKKHSPTPGNSVNWNVKEASPQFIEEERKLSKRKSKQKGELKLKTETARAMEPKIITEKYIVQKKVKKGFPATTVKVGNKTKIVYPTKKLQYSLNQQSKAMREMNLEALEKSRRKKIKVKHHLHTVEFVPRKVETAEQEMNKAAFYKRHYGKKGGNSGSQASGGGSSGSRGKCYPVTDDRGHQVTGFADPKLGAPSSIEKEEHPSIYGEHGQTGGNLVVVNKPRTIPQIKLNKEELMLIQKHPKMGKATKYGKMDINKKYNILLKMNQNKKKLAYHVVKPNEQKDTVNERNDPEEIVEQTVDAVEDPAESTPDPIVSHPAIIQPEPTFEMDPLKYRRSVIINKDNSYDIDDICLKSNDKSAHQISHNRTTDAKLWKTVSLKEGQRKVDESSKEQVDEDPPKRTVTPETIKELIDNQRFVRKHDIAAQNLKAYVTKLQQLRDQTSIDRAAKLPMKAPKVIQEAAPQNLEKEEPVEPVKKVVRMLRPGDLFVKKTVTKQSPQKKVSSNPEDTVSTTSKGSAGVWPQRLKATANQDDVEAQLIQSISAKVCDNIAKKLKQADKERKDQISEFGKLMEHSKRELKKIRVKSGRSHGKTHGSKTTKIRKNTKYLLEDYRPSKKMEQELEKVNVMDKLLDTYAVKVDTRKTAMKSEMLSNLKIKEILSRKDTQEKKKKVFMTDMELVPTKIGDSKKLQGIEGKTEGTRQQENYASSKTEKRRYLLDDVVVSQNLDNNGKVLTEQPSMITNFKPTEDAKKDVTKKSYLLSDNSKPVDKKDDATDSAAGVSRKKEQSSSKKSYQMSDAAIEIKDKEEQARLKSKSFVASKNKRDMLAFQSLTALKEKVKATEKHLIVKAETSPQRRAQKKYPRGNAEGNEKVPGDAPRFHREKDDTVQEYKYLLNENSQDQPENIDSVRNSGQYNEEQQTFSAGRSSKTDPKKKFLLENYKSKSKDDSESNQTDTLTKTVILEHPTFKCLLDNTSIEMATKEKIGTSEGGRANVRSNKLDISYPKVTNEMNTSNREYTCLLSAEHHGTDQSTTKETEPHESAATTKNEVEEYDRESEHGVENQHRRNLDRRNKYVPNMKNVSSENFAGLDKNSASGLPDASMTSYQDEEVSDIDSKVAEEDLIDQNVQSFYKGRAARSAELEEYEQQNPTVKKHDEELSGPSTDFGNLETEDVSSPNEASRIKRTPADFSMNIRHPQIPREPPPPPPKNDGNKKEKPKGKRDFILPPPKGQPSNTKLADLMEDRYINRKEKEGGKGKTVKFKIKNLKFKFAKLGKISPINNETNNELFIKPINESKEATEQTGIEKIYNSSSETRPKRTENISIQDIDKTSVVKTDRTEIIEGVFLCKNVIERNATAIENLKKLKAKTSRKEKYLVKAFTVPEEEAVSREMKSSYTVDDDKIFRCSSYTDKNTEIIKRNEQLRRRIFGKRKVLEEEQEQLENESELGNLHEKVEDKPVKGFQKDIDISGEVPRIDIDSLKNKVKDRNIDSRNLDDGHPKYYEAELPEIDHDKSRSVRDKRDHTKKETKTSTMRSRILPKKDKSPAEADFKEETIISKNLKSSYTVDDDVIFLSNSHRGDNIETIRRNQELRRRIFGKRKIFKEEQDQLEEEAELGSEPSEKLKDVPEKSLDKDLNTSEHAHKINIDNLRDEDDNMHINRENLEGVKKIERARQTIIDGIGDHPNLPKFDVNRKVPEMNNEKSGVRDKTDNTKKETKSPTKKSTTFARKDKSPAKVPMLDDLEEESIISKMMKSSYTVDDDKIFLCRGHQPDNIETIKKNEELRRRIFGRRKVFKEEQEQLEEEPELGSKPSENVKDGPAKVFDRDLDNSEDTRRINIENLRNEIKDINQERKNADSEVEKLRQKVISQQEDHLKLPELGVSKKVPEMDYEKSKSIKDRKKETKPPKSTVLARKDNSPAEVSMLADLEEESMIDRKMKCSYTVDDDKIFLSSSHEGKNIETIKKNEELRRRIFGKRKVFEEEQNQLEEEPELGIKPSEKIKDETAKVFEKDLDASKDTSRINIENLRNEIDDINENRKNEEIITKFEKLRQKVISGQEDHSKQPEVDISQKILEMDYEKNNHIKEKVDNTKKETKPPTKKFKTIARKDRSPAEAKMLADVSKRKGYEEEQAQVEETPYEKNEDETTEGLGKNMHTLEDTRRINIENLRQEIEDKNLNRQTAEAVDKFEKLRQKMSGSYEDHSKLPKVDNGNSFEDRMIHTKNEAKPAISTKNSDATKRSELAKSWSSRDVKSTNEENLKHEIAYKQFLREINSKHKDISDIHVDKISKIGDTKEVRHFVGGRDKRDPSKSEKEKIHPPKSVSNYVKPRSCSAPVKNRTKFKSPDMKIKKQYISRLNDEPDKGNKKADKLDVKDKKIHELSGSSMDIIGIREFRNHVGDTSKTDRTKPQKEKITSMDIGVIRETRNHIGDIHKTDPLKPQTENIVSTKTVRKEAKLRSNSAPAQKHSEDTNTDINSKSQFKYIYDDVLQKPNKKADKLEAKDKKKHEISGSSMDIAVSRKARNNIGDSLRAQKENIDSPKTVKKENKTRSYSAPVQKRTEVKSPDMKSKLQHTYILDNKSEKEHKKADKLDTSDKKTNDLFAYDMDTELTSKSKIRKTASSPHSASSRPQTVTSPLRPTSPMKPSISKSHNKELKETKTAFINLERPKQSVKITPEDSKYLSERAKRKSRSNSVQSQPKKDDDWRSQSPVQRAKSETSYYDQYKKRVQSLSPTPKSPKKATETGSEKGKQQYDDILEEKECDDCFSAAGKLTKDAKKGTPEGTKKASGGGKGSAAQPSKKKSNLVVNLILPKVEIKKEDTPVKITSMSSVPAKGDTGKKKADKTSAPTKAISVASVPQQKPIPTSIISTTKKKSYRLDDFVCADCFVKAKEEAKKSEEFQDPQAELKHLLEDPCSKILSSKYLLKPKKPYAKSCRLDEFESRLSNLLTPQPEQIDLKDTEKNAQVLTSETESKKTGTPEHVNPTASINQEITMMDAQEFKGTFVDQKQQQPKPQALLRVIATYQKPKPQEDDSKQKQAPAKLKPGKPSKKCIITLNRSPYMPIINVEKPKISYRLLRRGTSRNRSRPSARGRMHKPKKGISNSVIATKANKGMTPCKEMGINQQRYHEIYLRVIMERYRIDEIKLKEDQFSVPKIDIEFLKRKIRKEKMRRAMEKKLRRFFEGPKSGNPAFKTTDEFSKTNLEDLHDDIKRYQEARLNENLAGTSKSNEDKRNETDVIRSQVMTKESCKDETICKRKEPFEVKLNKTNLKDIHSDVESHHEVRLDEKIAAISKSHNGNNIKSDANRSQLTTKGNCEDAKYEANCEAYDSPADKNNVKSSVVIENLPDSNVPVKEPEGKFNGTQLSHNKVVTTKTTKDFLLSKYLLENQITTNPAQRYGFSLPGTPAEQILTEWHETKFKETTSKYLLEAQTALHKKAKKVTDIPLFPHVSKEPSKSKDSNSEKRTYATTVHTSEHFSNEFKHSSEDIVKIYMNHLKELTIANSENCIGKQVPLESEKAHETEDILSTERPYKKYLQGNNLKSDEYHLTSEAAPKQYKCLMQTQEKSHANANEQALLELQPNTLLAETPTNLRNSIQEKLQYKYLLQNQPTPYEDKVLDENSLIHKYLLQNQISSHANSSTDKQASLEFGVSSKVLGEIPSRPKYLFPEKIQYKYLLQNQASLYGNSNPAGQDSLELEATNILEERSIGSSYLLPEKLQYKYMLQNQGSFYENSHTDDQIFLDSEASKTILRDNPSSSRYLLSDKLQYKCLLQNQENFHEYSSMDQKASLEFETSDEILGKIPSNSIHVLHEQLQNKYLPENQASHYEHSNMDEKALLKSEATSNLGEIASSSGYLPSEKPQYKYLLQKQAGLDQNSDMDEKHSLEFETSNEILGEIPSTSRCLLQEKCQYKYLLQNQASLYENSKADNQTALKFEAGNSSLIRSSSRYLVEEEYSEKSSPLTDKTLPSFALNISKDTTDEPNTILGKSPSKPIFSSPVESNDFLKRHQADSNKSSNDNKESASNYTYILEKHYLSPRQDNLETFKYLLSQVDSDEAVNSKLASVTQTDKNLSDVHQDVIKNNIDRGDEGSVEKADRKFMLEIYASSKIKEPKGGTSVEADCPKTDIINLKSAEQPTFYQIVDLEMLKSSSSHPIVQKPLRKIRSETLDKNDKKGNQTEEIVAKRHQSLLENKINSPGQLSLPKLSENKPLYTPVSSQPKNEYFVDNKGTTKKNLRNYQCLLECGNKLIEDSEALISVEHVEKSKSIRFFENEVKENAEHHPKEIKSLYRMDQRSKPLIQCQVAENLEDRSLPTTSINCCEDQLVPDNFEKVLQNEVLIPKPKCLKEDEAGKVVMSPSPIQLFAKENSASNSKYLLDNKLLEKNVHKRTYVTHTSGKNLDRSKNSTLEPKKGKKRKSKKNIKMIPTGILEDDLRKYILDKNMSTIFADQSSTSQPCVKAKVEKIYDKEETVKKFNKKLFECVSSDQSKKNRLGILDLGKVSSTVIGPKSNETMCRKKEPPKQLSSDFEVTKKKKEKKKETPTARNIVVEKTLPLFEKQQKHKSTTKELSAFDAKLRVPPKSISKSLISQSVETTTTLNLDSNEKVMCIGKDDTKHSVLDKYKHLKITYVTVNRPSSKKNEEGLSKVTASQKDETMSQRPIPEVITQRYELLKKLHDEFYELNGNKDGNFDRASRRYDDIVKKQHLTVGDLGKTDVEPEKKICKINLSNKTQNRSLREKQIDNKAEMGSKSNMLDIVKQNNTEIELKNEKSDIKKVSKTNMLHVEKKRNFKMSESNKKDKVLSEGHSRVEKTDKNVVSGADNYNFEKQIKAKIETLDKKEVQFEKEICKNNIKVKPDDHPASITEILIKRITEADMVKEHDENPKRGQKK